MKKLIQSFLIVFAFLLVFSLLISGLNNVSLNQVSKQKVDLSSAIEKIRNGEAEKVIVKPSQIEVTLVDKTVLVAQKETNVSFPEILKNFNIPQETIDNLKIEIKEESSLGYWLSILLPIVLPIAFLFYFFSSVFKKANQGAAQIFSFSRSNIRLFSPTKDRITFKDVAGLKEAKEELQEVVEFLKNPKRFEVLGAKIPRGVLLVGPTGVGKTLLARAVAGEANVPFFHISGSEFVELFVGVGAGRVRDAFNTAKKAAPSILFIDEIDAIGRERGAGICGGHDEREQTLNQILVEMDGFDRDTRVIVMAASVTGDTPVLVKKNNQIFLKPIAEIIDNYYNQNEEGREKLSPDLEILGFDGKPNKHGIYFKKAVFKKVRSVFRHKVNEIYKIKFIGGEILATGNHSVFVRTKFGVAAKPVKELKTGEILVDLPYKVNRTNKQKREIRAGEFDEKFNLELPLWQPLFENFQEVSFAFNYALANANQISQTRLGQSLGYSQKTIGKWQQGICYPRELSKKYFKDYQILPEKIKVTKELMRLFGYYTAEGYSRKEVDFCLNIKEKEKIEDIKALMKQIFHLTPDRERNITSNAINIIYYSKPVAKFFAYYCGSGAHHKHLPPFLFEAPEEYFVEFLKGYAAGDGYTDSKGRLEITSVSEQLINELNWLSRLHGYKCYIRQSTVKALRRIKNGKPLKETKAWRIGYGKTQNPINPQPGKASTNRAIIKNIEKMPYEGYVYDFCGCENEAFFGGRTPILLHNTNRPDILDAALLRPGRFDRRIVLDLPDIKEREEILKIHSKDKKLGADVNLREIAERTPGFSGADLANLTNEAAILAARRNKKLINQNEFLEAIEKVILGPERKSRVLSLKEKEITAYHEAGHALVSSLIPNSTAEVRKVSIISRGRAGGYTMRMPKEEKYLKTRSEFLADIVTLLGGYVAEELKYKEISTGAANDLREASDIARALVTKYGMSKDLGPITFGKTEDLIFLGREIMAERDYSEETAQKIDKEVTEIIKKCYNEAKKILKDNFNKLEKVAQKLIEKETLEKEELEKIIKE